MFIILCNICGFEGGLWPDTNADLGAKDRPAEPQKKNYNFNQTCIV